LVELDAIEQELARFARTRALAQWYSGRISGSMVSLAQPAYRATQLALEVSRLELLENVFVRRAISHAHAGTEALVVKLSQHKLALLGLNQPMRFDLQVAVQPYQESSTEHLRHVLDELKAEPVEIEVEPQTKPE